MSEMNFDKARFNMIEQQVRPWDVLDSNVLRVMNMIPREDFVPADFRKLAFTDMQIPLANGQVMMSPTVEGRMLQALAVQDHEDVLEVGTGSGFVTACLAALAKHVTSVEIDSALSQTAQQTLKSHGIMNADLLVADINHFNTDKQFDVIVFTGACAQVPEQFTSKLKVGGRLFVITGQQPVMTAQLITRVAENSFITESLFETQVPYLSQQESKPSFRF